MADRVKTWDVDDDKSLRRSTGAHDGYTDNEYYTQFSHARDCNHNGSESALRDRVPTIILASGSDKYVQFIRPWKDYWKYGQLVLKSAFWHNNSVLNATVEIEQSMYGYHLWDPDGTTVDSVGFNTGDNQIITLDNTGSFAQSITVTTTTTNAAVSRVDRNILGIRVQRLGNTGTDTYTGNLHYVCSWLIWKPSLRQ